MNIRTLSALDLDNSRIQQASEVIGRVMKIVPEAEDDTLYELARKSARDFLERRRHDGRQDVILLDSVLSIRQHYRSVVKWDLAYEDYISSKNIAHELATLAGLNVKAYLHYLRSSEFSDILPPASRVKCAVDLAKLFLRRFPESLSGKPTGLFRWVEESEGWTQFLRPYLERDAVCRALTDSMLKEFNVTSYGPMTSHGLALFQYLRMQCGEDTLKPDVRVIRGLRESLQVPTMIDTDCIVIGSKISKRLNIRMIELDQILVCEDYLRKRQKFLDLLGTLGH